MIQGTWQDATIEINGTESAEVNLGRAYDTLLIVIPTIDSAQISLQVAEKAGGTFQDLYITNTSGDDNQPITTAGTGGITWSVPIGGFQFIKIKASVAQSGGARTFRVCGIRS